MDTRRKIIRPDEAVAEAERLQARGIALSVVTGYFDPLLAWHAGRLKSIREGAGALMVVVTSPVEPVLSAGARAELVAALTVVDYVVLSENAAVEGLLLRIPAAEAIRLEETDEEIRRELILHVRNRQYVG